MATALKNVSSWRLNNAEKEELQRRVAAGEEEVTVKRELQTLKAQASLDRKLAADAVAKRCVAQQKQAAKAKAKGKAAAKAAPVALQPTQNQGDTDLINKECKRICAASWQSSVQTLTNKCRRKFLLTRMLQGTRSEECKSRMTRTKPR